MSTWRRGLPGVSSLAHVPLHETPFSERLTILPGLRLRPAEEGKALSVVVVSEESILAYVSCLQDAAEHLFRLFLMRHLVYPARATAERSATEDKSIRGVEQECRDERTVGGHVGMKM